MYFLPPPSLSGKESWNKTMLSRSYHLALVLAPFARSTSAYTFYIYCRTKASPQHTSVAHICQFLDLSLYLNLCCPRLCFTSLGICTVTLYVDHLLSDLCITQHAQLHLPFSVVILATQQFVLSQITQERGAGKMVMNVLSLIDIL